MERLMKAIEDVPTDTFDRMLHIILALKEFKSNQSPQQLEKPHLLKSNQYPQQLEKSNQSPQLLEKPDCNPIPEKFHEPTSMQTMIDALKMSIKVLRMLTQQTPSIRAIFGDDPKTIYQMLSLQSKVYNYLQPDVQEDVIAMIENIAVHDDNISKRMLGQNSDVIPLLIKALWTGNTDTRTRAIKAINALSTDSINKLKLGALGVMEALVQALEHNAVAEKDVFEVLFKLCEEHDGRWRVLQLILDPIRGQKIVGRMLPLLEKLSMDENGCKIMCKYGAVCCLLGIIRETTDPSYQEISATILFKISFYKIGVDKQYSLREIRDEEEALRTISQLAKNGTQLGQIMAQSILDILRLQHPTA